MDRKGGSTQSAQNIGRIFNFFRGSHGKKAIQLLDQEKHCTYEYSDYYECKHSLRDTSLICLRSEKELINDEVILIALSILTDQFYKLEDAYGWEGIFIIKDPIFAHQLLAINCSDPSKKSFKIGNVQLSHDELAKHVGGYFGKASGRNLRGWTLENDLDGYGINQLIFPCCIPHKHWFMVRILLEEKKIMCSSSDYRSILFGKEELPEEFSSFQYSFNEEFLCYMKSRKKTKKVLNSWCQKLKLYSKNANVQDSLITLFMCYTMNQTASFVFDQFQIDDPNMRLEWKLCFDHEVLQIDGSKCDGGLYCLHMIDTTLRDYRGDTKYFNKIEKNGRGTLLNYITNLNFVTRKYPALEEDDDDDDEVQIVEETMSVEEVITTIASPSRANPNRKAKLLSQPTPRELPNPDLTETLNTTKMGTVGTKLLKSIFLDYKADDESKKIFRNYLREFGAYVLTNAPIESTPDEDLKILAYILIEHNHLREFPETENEPSEEIPETKIEQSQSCAIVHLHSHTTNHDYSKSVFGKGPRNTVRENREKGLFQDSIPLRYLMSQVARMLMSKNKRDGTKMKALYFPVYKTTTGEHGHHTRKKKTKTESIVYPDKFKFRREIDKVVEQNQNLRKLFGFHIERKKPPVNALYTTEEYEWLYKPDIEYGSKILLIGQTISHVAKCALQNLTNMEGQLKFLFGVGQEQDLSSHVMYLDPHAVTDIQFFPAEESNAEPNLYANNRWFGYKHVPKGNEKTELALSENLTSMIEDKKKETKTSQKRQWIRPEVGGAVSFISKDRSCVWLSLKSMLQRHFSHLLPRCKILEDKYSSSKFEDMRFFKAKVKGKDIPLSELLKEMSIQIVKVKTPDKVDIFSFLQKELKDNKCYLCMLTNIHRESIHAIGIETFNGKVILNDSGIIHEYDGKNSLSKCLGDIPCIDVKFLCHLNL